MYKISVTMAIYNVEDYIDECMNSLINQTIGFENIQVVMVDDCSTDNTREICRKYAQRYPDNIIYIEKTENSGVSITRNMALQRCTGEITTSVDPDDYVDLELFENAYNYYQEVKDDVDVVAVPLHFFEGSNDYHINSKYRFQETRVIDITEEYYHIHPSTCGTFATTSILQKFGYPVNLNVDSEDLYLITHVILEKNKYAVLVNGGEYRYRKRSSQDSLTQTYAEKKEWYIDKMDNFFIPLINYSKSKYGKTLRYIQFICRYLLQWNIKYNYGTKNILSTEETEIYLSKLKLVLNEVEDDILVNRIKDKKLDSNIHLINMFVKCKYGEDAPVKYIYKGENMYMTINQELLYTIKDHGVNIQFINFEKNKIHIGGFYTDPFLNANLKLEVMVNDKKAQFKIIPSELYSVKYFGVIATQGYEFLICEEIHDNMQIRLYLENEQIKYLAPIVTYKSPYNKIYTKCPESYYVYNNSRLKLGKKVIYLSSITKKEKKKLEIQYLKRLLFGKKLLRKKSTNIKVVLMRCLYWVTQPCFEKKKIWLFMDRMNISILYKAKRWNKEIFYCK